MEGAGAPAPDAADETEQVPSLVNSESDDGIGEVEPVFPVPVDTTVDEDDDSADDDSDDEDMDDDDDEEEEADDEEDEEEEYWNIIGGDEVDAELGGEVDADSSDESDVDEAMGVAAPHQTH